MDNWDSMLEFARSRPSGLSQLVEEHGATASYEIAGPLLVVLNQLLREGSAHASAANSALFSLVRTLRVWEMAPWAPEGLLNTLERAIDDHGIPREADRSALAELIERAASQDERTMGCRLEILNISTINVCSSLLNCGELVSVLACRPGARESVIAHIEAMKRRFSTANTQLYSGEVEYVLKALRDG